MENSRRLDYLVNWDSRMGYKIMSHDPIGRDSDGNPVYKVAFPVVLETPGERSLASHGFLSMKTVNSSSSVLQTLSRNLDLPGDHKNLTRLEAHFVDRSTGNACIAMPFFEHGSLRYVMAAKFPDGLPEACISVSLRCALKALRFLHRAGALHRDIHAGHIYVKSGPQISLGFGATLYEHGASLSRAECSSSSSLPATGISTWAAAPEVYNGEDSHGHSEKSDIWLVGITALELAYGRVTFPDREALEMTIRAITQTERLPKKLGPEGQQWAVAIREDRKGKRKMETKKRDWEEEERLSSSFSMEFGEFLAQCLAWSPESRPSIDALLNHAFFCKNGLKRSQLKSRFQDLLVGNFEELNPQNGKLSLLEEEDKDEETRPKNFQRTESTLLVYELLSYRPLLPCHQQAAYLMDPSTRVLYRIMGWIGLSLPDNFPVYRAAYSKWEYTHNPYDRAFIHDKFCSIKIVNCLHDRTGYTKLRRGDLVLIKDTFFQPHERFVDVVADFVDGDSLDYCVVFGFAEYGSLRRIVADHFPNGLPEVCIMFVLRTVLEGVDFLHDNWRIHGDIDAGHLYVGDGPRVRLGYAATVYECGIGNPECSTSGALPEIGISKWAAAPEVYNDNGGENHFTTVEGDIWLVGILALDLAYGGLRVPSREALGAMIRGINETRRLPGGEEGDGWFTPEFGEFVADCLIWDLWERPSASSLLNHKFFTKSGIDSAMLEAIFDEIVIQRIKK